jgi:protocatechuate 3,4-dioxygenase beta subunit
MAVTHLRAVSFCAGVLLAVASAQTLGTGAVSGTVVDKESGDPIRKAIVTLTLEDTPRRWATARTDGAGHFAFQGLPAGKYELRATKEGEGTAIYGASQLRELGDPIALADGETRGNLVLRFLHPASLTGHVYDSDGEPLADVNVALLRPGRNLGAPTLGQYRNAVTDDRGQFSFTAVDSGRYYLRAEPRFFGPSAPSILVEQYYGGSRDAAGATPVHVAGGEKVEGLDFRLFAQPAVEIHGRLLGIPEQSDSAQVSKQVPFARVAISPIDGSPRMRFGVSTRMPEQTFDFAGLPAARYRITAEYQRDGKTFTASQIVDAQPGSGEIVLTLAPAVDVHGILRVEGTAPPADRGSSPTPRPALQVLLGNPSTQRTYSAEVGVDGRFTIPQVPAGEWELGFRPNPPGYLKSAKYGDKDVRFTTFEIPNGDATLNILVSMHTGAVKGDVDVGSSPRNRAGILIVPVGQYHNFTRFYHAGMTADKGKFRIGSIAPGKYKIFALEKMAATNFRNPEAADQLDQLGEIVDIAEDATAEVHLKLIPADRAVQALQ